MPTAPSLSLLRTLVVVNPVSGRGRAREVAPAVVEALRAQGSVRTLETSRRGDAEAIARQNAGEVDRIVVVGGDGTLNEVVNGLDGRVVPLGQIPIGGANVLARELGIPLDVAAAARALRDAVPRRIDAGRCRGRRFLLMVGAGFDADVVHRVASSRGTKCGLRGYLRPFAASWRAYPLRPFSVIVDGESLAADATQAVVANTRNYGGLAAVAPAVAPDDGRLDVVALRARSKWTFVRHGWRAWRGGLREHALVRVRVGTRVTLAGDSGIPVQIDGDAAGFLPVDVEIAPGSVEILVPAPRGAR
jgi:diacylglycerol kinase (ATP)